MEDNELFKIHDIWKKSNSIISKEKTPLDFSKFNELLGAIFCPGPYCCFVIDFYDMSIVYESPTVKQLLPIDGEVNLQSILATIHPDDMDFISKAEETFLDFLYKKVGRDKVLKYKLNRCMRAKDRSGEYRLFSHQAIILTVDRDGNFGKSLNIVTDISHITSINNYKISIIGLGGEPSYLNIDVDYQPQILEKLVDSFSSREVQIIKMIRDGLTSKEIASSLNISLHTVQTHRKNILSKSKAKSTAHLISRCIKEGLF